MVRYTKLNVVAKMTTVLSCAFQAFVLILVILVAIVLPIAVAAYLCDVICVLEPWEYITIGIATICCITFVLKSM